MNTSTLIRQSSTSLVNCSDNTPKTSYYQEHHSDGSMVLSTVLILVMPRLAIDRLTECRQLSSKVSAHRSMTCYVSKLYSHPNLPGVLQPYSCAEKMFKENHSPQDSLLTTVLLILSQRAMVFLSLKSSTSWTGLAVANRLPNSISQMDIGKFPCEKRTERKQQWSLTLDCLNSSQCPLV